MQSNNQEATKRTRLLDELAHLLRELNSPTPSSRNAETCIEQIESLLDGSDLRLSFDDEYMLYCLREKL